MRITDTNFVRQALNNINSLNKNLDDLRLDIATEQRIRKLSDDPRAVYTALEVQGDKEDNEQYVKNIDDLDAYTSHLDISLGAMEESFIDIRSKAVQSMDVITPKDRENLANHINLAIDQFLKEANQSYEGEYIFSGTATSTRAFKATYSGGKIVAVDYKGNTDHMDREISKGLFVKYNITGEDLIGGVSDRGDPFEVMMSLRDNIASGTVTSIKSMNLPGSTLTPTTVLNSAPSPFIINPDDNGGAGVVRINNVDINWDAGQDIQTIINNINSSSAGVQATFDQARQKLLLTPDDINNPLEIEDISGNFAEFTYLGEAPKVNNEFLDVIDKSFNNLLSLRSKTGIVGERIEESQTRLEVEQTSYQQRIVDEIGTDVTKAIVDMMAYEKSLQGALSVTTRMSDLSLMDFLS